MTVGQTVAVRHTASATNDTATTTTLNIGGVTAPFVSATVAASGPDAFTLYQTKFTPGIPTDTCASCHSLGALDTTGSPNLAGTTAMPVRYPTPGAAGHFGIVLTAPEISALTTLFQSLP